NWIPIIPFSSAYKGKNEVIPPNVNVIKNNKMDGFTAVLSTTSNRAGFVLFGDSSTFWYLIFSANTKAVKPSAAQIKNNCVKDIKSANVKPKAGPNANAKLPDKPK